ncbi:hypothetical protein BJ912DRAFT_1145201 [Pholiota molesta]|nr:hypothetical protein BJ912DRAFT_1145201 [Pholiota molesta]
MLNLALSLPLHRTPATLQRTQYRLQNRFRAMLGRVGLSLRVLPLDNLLLSPRPLRLHVQRRSPASPVGINNIISVCPILSSTKCARAIAETPVYASYTGDWSARLGSSTFRKLGGHAQRITPQMQWTSNADREVAGLQGVSNRDARHRTVPHPSPPIVRGYPDSYPGLVDLPRSTTSVHAARHSKAQYRELGSFDQSGLTPRLVTDHVAPVLFHAGSAASGSGRLHVIRYAMPPLALGAPTATPAPSWLMGGGYAMPSCLRCLGSRLEAAPRAQWRSDGSPSPHTS